MRKIACFKRTLLNFTTWSEELRTRQLLTATDGLSRRRKIRETAELHKSGGLVICFGIQEMGYCSRSITFNKELVGPDSCPPRRISRPHEPLLKVGERFYALSTTDIEKQSFSLSASGSR